VLAYINGEYGYFDGLLPHPRWRPRLTDSNGSAGLIERLQPLNGPSRQTAGWTYNSKQGGSAFMVALGASEPCLAGA
jgi:hypothetical protein